MTEMKLRNCPFCGSDNVKINYPYSYSGSSVSCVQCYGCGCTTAVFVSEDKTIEAWNQRIPSANQWISVDQKLPEVGQDVLIHYVRKSDPSDDGITITKRIDYIWFGHAIPTEPYWKDPWQYFHSDYSITHWMHLPEAPEVKNDDN